MADDFTKTVRIQRPSRVAQDERGRNVWVGRVESVELELVSTTALERILKTADGATRTEIRKLASGPKEGVLARDTATGMFQILSDADLKAAVEVVAPQDGPKRSAEVRAAPVSEKTLRDAERLSLASTQFLRKVVKADGKAEYESSKPAKRDKSAGFDPYDNN